MTIGVRKLSGHVGAEITGVDLEAIDDARFDAVRDALFAHGVVVIRDQTLTPEGHVRLAERFGPVDVNRFIAAVDGHPKIAAVFTPADANEVIGGSWHTDHSYDPAPAMASILVARELPPYGGDTLFASQTAALRGLSSGLREVLEGLWAWHSDESFDGYALAGIDDSDIRGAVRHPVVIAHPQTGEPALYVNDGFTVRFDGWSAEDSAPLLSHLYAQATRPEISCRVQWAPGSVVIWDNRLVQHFASADYQGHARLMHRVTIEGQALQPAVGAA